MINSKLKGNSYERKVAKILSERFQEYTQKRSSFYRNVDSGSYFGGKNQDRKLTHSLDKAEFGDIVTPSNFNFSVECKHYKTGPTFSSIISQNCKMLDEWIKKAEQDAANSKRKMAIIMKFNNVKEAVLLDYVPDGLKSIINYQEYHIFTLDDFLSLPDDVFFTKKS